MTVRRKGNIIMKLMGYKRENGTFGIRNHLLILPTSVCSSETAQRIAELVPGAVAVPHQHGCCQVGADYLQTVNTLVGFGKNPNVGAVLVVSLGCEGIQPDVVADQNRESKKPVETVIIQECGGTLGCIAKGAEIAAKMARELSVQNKVEFDIGELVLGLECGGSDPTSGIAGNPSVGAASDKLIELGGTSILSETTELIGAEHLVAARCVTKEMGDKLTAMVKRIEDKSKLYGVDLRGTQPTPGNIAGGLSSIEEKSLGAIVKSGHRPIQGVLEYCDRVDGQKGLWIKDAPGREPEILTGMAATGAQFMMFSTGRGAPQGFPSMPVIKICGNPHTYERMQHDMDLNAGRIIQGEKTIEEVGEEAFRLMLDVLSGKMTKNEALGYYGSMDIFCLGPVI